MVLNHLGAYSNVLTLPGCIKCPLCGAEGSLDVAYGIKGIATYQCSKCRFLGDGVKLLKEHYQDASTLNVISHLISSGSLAHDPELIKAIGEYDSFQKEYEDTALAFWNTCQDNLLRGGTAVSGFLQTYNMWKPEFNPHLSSNVGFAFGGAVCAHYGIRTAFFTKSRARPLLVIPLWSGKLNISAFVFMNAKGETAILGANPRDTQAPILGTGFIPSTTPWADSTLVTLNPTTAVRLHIAMAHQNVKANIVYAPHNANFDLIPKTSRTLVIVEGDTGQALYLGYNLRNVAKLLTLDELVQSAEKAYSFDAILLHAWEKGVSVHEYIAREIATKDATEAYHALRLLTRLQAHDWARITSHATAQNRERFHAFIEGNKTTAFVQVQGTTITHTDTGWHSAKDGCVSDTIIIPEQICYDNHTRKSLLRGVICQSGRSFSFSVSLSDIEKNPYDWLCNEVLLNSGNYPEVDRKWRRMLLDIAFKFNKPSTTFMNSSLGWSDGGTRLTLPLITIDRGSIYPSTVASQDKASGMRIGLPEALTPEDLHILSDGSTASAGFFALLSCVLVNMFNAVHRRGTFGIAVVNEYPSTRALTTQLVDTLGLRRVTLPTANKTFISELVNAESSAVAPYYMEDAWCKTEAFRRWLESGTARNTILCVDRMVAVGLSLQPGWMHVDMPPIENVPSYERLWKILPLFIVWTQKETIRWPSTRGECGTFMLHLLDQWLASAGAKAEATLALASRLVRVDISGSDTVWGGRFLNFVVALVQDGAIPVAKTGLPFNEHGLYIDTEKDVVYIPLFDTLQHMREYGACAPLPKYVYDELNAIRALSATSYNGYNGVVIPRDLYSMYVGLLGTVSSH